MEMQQTLFTAEEFEEEKKKQGGWLPDTIPPIDAKIPDPLPEWFTLRPVQVVMKEGHRKAYQQGFNSPLIMAMTSSGKTLYTAELFHDMLTKNPNQRLLFTVPRINLVDQALEEFESLGLKPSIIWQKDPRFNPAAQIHIASIDTMLRRMTSKCEKTREFFKGFNFDMWGIDEAHLRRKALNQISFTRRFGLSASPFSQGLAQDFDKLVKTKDTKELIADGTIKPYWPIAATARIDETKLKVASNGEFVEAEEELATNELIGDVIGDLKTEERYQGRKWIAFCKTIASCQFFHDEMNKAGIKVGMIHSKMSASDREATLKASKLGVYEGLVSVVALREGYSDKKVNMVIWLTTFAADKKDPNRPNNLNGWVQGNGRGGRANEGDDDCIIADYGNNWARFGSPYTFVDDLNHLDDGEVKEKEENTASDNKPKPKKPIECNVCHTMIDVGNVCVCGNVVETYTQYIEGEPVQFKKGKLVELDNHVGQKKEKKSFTQNEKQAFWQGLKHEANLFGQRQKSKGKDWNDRKGYGWSMAKYKEHFGVEPPNDRSFKNKPATPDPMASAYVDAELKKWINQQRRKSYAQKVLKS